MAKLSWHAHYVMKCVIKIVRVYYQTIYQTNWRLSIKQTLDFRQRVSIFLHPFIPVGNILLIFVNVDIVFPKGVIVHTNNSCMNINVETDDQSESKVIPSDMVDLMSCTINYHSWNNIRILLWFRCNPPYSLIHNFSYSRHLILA